MADHTSSTNSHPNHTTNPTTTPITNRRHLLFGTSAAALATSAVLASPLRALAGGMPVSVAARHDPAYRAFLEAAATEHTVKIYSGPEDDYYESLNDIHIAAERTLAATPSLSLHGLYGKITRLIVNMCGGEDDPCLDTILSRSVLRDLERMTGHGSSIGGRP